MIGTEFPAPAAKPDWPVMSTISLYPSSGPFPPQFMDLEVTAAESLKELQCVEEGQYYPKQRAFCLLLRTGYILHQSW